MGKQVTSYRKVLVTGGAGFVGSNVVRLLIERGLEVSIFDSFVSGSPKYLSNFDVEIITGDIRNQNEINAALKGRDAVIHLAASGNVIDSIADPVSNFEVNVRGTLNTLQAAVKADIQKFVFSSTGGALMGNTPPPVNERSVPKPISPYGASKLACEGYLSAFSEAYELNTVAFRFANVYGPNSAHKQGVVNKFIKAMADGEDLIVYGNSVRDFIHVDDLARGIVAGLFENVSTGETFHLSSNIGTKISDLASTLIHLNGTNRSKVLVKPSRKGEVVENFADNSHAKKVLGFRINTHLDDGLAATLEWFKTHEHLWRF